LFFYYSCFHFTVCNESESFNPDDNYFKASAFVEVVDLTGHPLGNVAISTLRTTSSGIVESEYGTTNAEGVLQVKNIYMFPSTYFTASKPGYFQGSRRIYPEAGQTHFIKIILLDADYAGTFDAADGGDIDLQDQVSLSFPPGSIVSKNGELYTGEVRVNAQPIAADDKDLLYKMPGDLVGFNNTGNRVALGSFGMVGIELRSPWNELLNLKEGKTVEMKMKVPDDKLSKAPSTIPMWYFDESEGYWKEDGSASLEGNEYVAQLPHFSFWNCDASFEAVKLEVRFVYENGDPIAQVDATITIISLGASSGGETNNDGYVSGLVPANEKLLLEISTRCHNAIFSKEVGPFGNDVNLGSIIVVSDSLYVTQIAGKALNCDDSPLINGYARIKLGSSSFYTPFDEHTGDFSLSIMACTPADLKVKVFDIGALKESQELIFPFDPYIQAGSIQVCRDWTEFIELYAVGRPEHFFFNQPYAYTGAGYIIMGALDSLPTHDCYFLVPASAAGTYPPDVSQVGLTFPNGDRLFGSAITVTFTEFGEAGGFLRGTISGTLLPDAGSTGGTTQYPLSGTFAIQKQ
jgi:hypothetical protein